MEEFLCGNFLWNFSLDFLCYYTLECFCWIFCVTILWYFCVGLLVAGAFYMVPLAYDNGMVPRYGERESRHRATPLMFA